jgi:hypothetical protein
MKKTTYKELCHFWYDDWIKGAELDVIKQSYHFGDIVSHEKFIAANV